MENLRELRKGKGKTLQQVQMELKEMGYDINYSGICKYERGIQRTTEYAKKALCEYYGVEDFTEETNDYLELNKKIKELERENMHLKKAFNILMKKNNQKDIVLKKTLGEVAKLEKKIEKIINEVI